MVTKWNNFPWTSIYSLTNQVADESKDVPSQSDTAPPLANGPDTDEKMQEREKLAHTKTLKLLIKDRSVQYKKFTSIQKEITVIL